MFLPGGIIGGALPSITRTDTGSYASTSVNPITFASRSFGAEGRRHIGITVGWFDSTTISNVTVASITATLVASVVQQTTLRNAIYIASIPTGIAGDVVVTFSGVQPNAFIAVYALMNLRSATPVATVTDGVNGTTTPTYTLDLDANVSARGVVMSSFTGAGVTVSPTAVGMNNNVAIFHNASNSRVSAADYTATAAETPRTMGWTVNNDTCGCLATFR